MASWKDDPFGFALMFDENLTILVKVLTDQVLAGKMTLQEATKAFHLTRSHAAQLVLEDKFNEAMELVLRTASGLRAQLIGCDGRCENCSPEKMEQFHKKAKEGAKAAETAPAPSQTTATFRMPKAPGIN